MPARFTYIPPTDGYGPVFSSPFSGSELTLPEAIEVVQWCREAFGDEKHRRWTYHLERLEVVTLEVKRKTTAATATVTAVQLKIGLTAVADADRFKLRWSWLEDPRQSRGEAPVATTPAGRVHRIR